LISQSLKRLGVAALCLAGIAAPAAAQNIPRIKASVVSFNGSTLVVLPEGEKDTMRVTVRPATQMLEEQVKSFSDIQVGDFIGATLARNSLGVLSAQEVHIFPAAMHGSGEGLYPPTSGSPGMILNGTVGQINTARLGVRFRGASGEGPYMGGPGGGQGCNGRAPLDPLSGCQGSIIVAVPANTPVIALGPADKSHIKPGTVLALSLVAGPDGRPATPGFTIESVATPPVPLADTPAPAKSQTKSQAKSLAKPTSGKNPQ
jgi:hypothetical protein